MGTGNARLGTALRGVRTAMGALGAVLAATAWAQVPGEKSVDGVRVSVGIATVEQIEALPTGRPERAMHATHARNDRDHLVVALADQRTGRAIERASVTATVSRLGMSEDRRALGRMEEAGTTSWGGYFDLREPGPYVIHVEVARPGWALPIVADFTYRSP